jgi:hypothetical protein
MGKNGSPPPESIVHRWPLEPNIRLFDEDWLAYDDRPRDPEKWEYVEHPGPKLLSDFIALAEAPAAQIEAYAQRWSVLALCEHGAIAHTDDHPKLGYTCPPINPEPLNKWRQYARSFGERLKEIEKSRGNRQKESTIAAIVTVDGWSVGRLRPAIIPTANGFTLRLAGNPLGAGGLIAALSYQLLNVVVGGRAWLICAGCGDWFEPDIRRSPKRRAYCPNCGRAEAVRAASRDYYQRRVLASRGAKK